MTGGVCLIGFGTVLTAWRGQHRTEPDCNAVRKQSSGRKGVEKKMKKKREKTEGESTLDEESMMTMRISVVRRP